MTTEPNALCATVHHRMPMILDPDEIDAWLDPCTSLDILTEFLDAYPDERMSKRRVGKKLNSARYDSPDLEAPIRSAPHGRR